MRSGELIALEWSQYQDESLRIHQSRVRGRRKDTKTHRERRVYLPTWLHAELNAHWTRPKQDAIFLNQYGRAYQKPDKLNRVFRRCLTELAIRPRRGPYPWRHTYASIGISEGAAPAFLARQLGHALETFMAPMRNGCRTIRILRSARLLRAPGEMLSFYSHCQQC